ncbi:MAG: trigger factor, partial [Cycloclasticus sp.]
FYKAIMDEKLNPASAPVITPNDDNAEGYAFSASFEVYPEISVNPIENLEINSPVAVIADTDIDAMVEKLQSQKLVWKEVKFKIKNGSRATLNFEGSVNGTAISEEPIKDFPIEVGSGNMIPGFEKKLIGAKTGEKLSFEVTFPEDYQQKDFAGEVGKFDVEVVKVETSKEPKVDEAFIKEFGVESGNLEDFRADLTKNMTLELDRALAAKRKEVVMDALVENNEVSVPEALVDNEIEQMIASFKKKTEQAQQAAFDLPKEVFQEQAAKRVKLGLLLSEVIKVNDIKADDEKVEKRIEEFSQTYGDPAEVINWYSSNPQERAKVESVVLEDQLVEWVLEKAKVTETSLSFEELMSPAKISE